MENLWSSKQIYTSSLFNSIVILSAKYVPFFFLLLSTYHSQHIEKRYFSRYKCTIDRFHIFNIAPGFYTYSNWLWYSVCTRDINIITMNNEKKEEEEKKIDELSHPAHIHTWMDRNALALIETYIDEILKYVIFNANNFHKTFTVSYCARSSEWSPMMMCA